MTPDDVAIWDGATAPAATHPQAVAAFRALGFDPRAVEALDVVRVLVRLEGAPLPAPAASWFADGRRYVVALFDRYGYAAGLRAFPHAKEAPGLVLADRGGLAVLRAPGGLRDAVTIAEGLPNFLRAALRRSSAPRTLGVVTAADWNLDLGSRLASRTARIEVLGTATLADAVRATCEAARVEVAESSES